MRTLFLALGLAVATPASASVVSASASGFELRHTIDLPVPPAQALAAFGQVSHKP